MESSRYDGHESVANRGVEPEPQPFSGARPREIYRPHWTSAEAPALHFTWGSVLTASSDAGASPFLDLVLEEPGRCDFGRLSSPAVSSWDSLSKHARKKQEAQPNLRPDYGIALAWRCMRIQGREATQATLTSSLKD